jgi:hypothetical protein
MLICMLVVMVMVTMSMVVLGVMVVVVVVMVLVMLVVRGRVRVRCTPTNAIRPATTATIACCPMHLTPCVLLLVGRGAQKYTMGG